MCIRDRGPLSSQAFTAKSTILPFSETAVISASAHTFMPMGVGASWEMSRWVPTLPLSLIHILTEKEAQGLESAIKPGMWLCVQGKMEPTWDGKDIQLNPYHIQLAEHTERQDTAPEKRVELHLHTKMSNMDALTDTKEVVQQAIRLSLIHI